MNNDLISREALKKAIEQIREDYVNDNFFWIKLFNIIDNAPTVEIPTELCKGCRFLKDCETCEEKLRPQGEWYYNYQNGWHCSICHETVKDMPTVKGKADYNFCPRCGADMRGGAE